MNIKIRRTFVVVEEIREEAGHVSNLPLRRVAAAAVVENPYAGRYVEDLAPMIEGSIGLGKELGEIALSALGKKLRQQMQVAGVTQVLAMGEWNTSPDDPLGVNRTLALARQVPGLRAIGIADPTKADSDHFQRCEEVLRTGAVTPGQRGWPFMQTRVRAGTGQREPVAAGMPL